MLAVDLLQIGAVYTEADLGSDVHGDTFEITFEGGAPGTQLTRLVVNGDQGTAGFGEGDVFFDHEAGGYGADDAHAFTIVALETDDPNASVAAFVEDGGLMLTLELVSFRAGDRLIFSIDVDEVEDFDPNESDLTLVNEGFDPITSGVEFQGSQLSAQFVAPHYFDASGSGEFRNRYDDALAASGLDLPQDNAGGQRDRTDGAIFPVEQVPLPIAISGTVFLDSDLDLAQDAGDVPLSGVELSLWVETHTPGNFEFTGHTVTTDTNGDYEFGLSLELPPGVYQVREVQPNGLFSVGAVPGTIAGTPVGAVGDADRLTGIAFPRGGERAIDYDFAEAQPASISGYVYHDRDNNGIRDASGTEEGLSGVVVDVIPVSTIAPQATVRQITDANGFYSAAGLAPGDYRVVEVNQPAAFFDGLDRAGTVAGQSRGAAVNPGDSLEGIGLSSADAGIEYNFGELAPAWLSGRVHLSNADGDCFGEQSVLPPLEGVTVQLLDADGQHLRETTTDVGGDYQFDQLLPGEYTLVELTPSGLLDGSEHVGSVSGNLRGQLSSNDRISMIVLGSGDQGVRYDFCEHEPASVSGFVYHDLDNNGNLDAAEERIAGVEVSLLDDVSQVIATQQTSADGFYAFTQLRRGRYSVRETQPAGWIDGLDSAGTIDGVQIGVAENPGDILRDVDLRYGDRGLNYNFGELLPVKIGGFVYHDRNDNGIREAGEEGLAGVTLTVMPLDTFAQQQAVTVTTSADGMYMTGMLSPGRYEIIENVQPTGYFDGQDTPGQVAGQPQGIVAHPGDRLTDILLTSGQVGTDYNFGELLPSSISGRVHLSDSSEDCFDESVVHPPVSGVVLSLLNEHGDTIARTTTDAHGEYQFQGLVPGTYTVVEEDPAGLLDGGERAGQVDGVVVGEVTANDTIGSIVLLAGQNAVHYDFCEHEPAQISGYVYHDSNNNGEFETGEEAISGVTVSLFDGDGVFLEAQQTDADGSYEFNRLLAGVYDLREQQPDGWSDGLDTAGTVRSAVVGAAMNPGDAIDGIQLAGGDRGVQYNFGELLPASISGTIHSDLNENCEVDAGEALLAGVNVELLDPSGRVIASTRSDDLGRYRFDDLLPGRYSVREVQPDGFFQGHQRPGSHGAQHESQDLITVDLVSGDQLVDYDFCETPPSQLSGYVFQDGPTIVTPNGEVPDNLAEIRDGQRTPDDIPIAGVLLQLRDGLDGRPITAVDALPGFYQPGQISAVTGPDGFYEFPGIRGNANYAVYQVHPAEFIDGIDTAGSTSGLAVNLPAGATSPLVERYAGIPRNDAIVLIPLRAGDASLENNFSEVRTELERSPSTLR